MFGRRLIRALVVATIASLVMATAAFADQLVADADALSTANPAANAIQADQQPGTTVEYDLSAHVNSTGAAANHVFKFAGDRVDVTISRSGDWLATAGGAGTPAAFAFTAYDVNQAGKIRITVPCGTPANTVKTMSAVLTSGASYNTINAADSNANTLNPDIQTLTYEITAKGADALSCAPSNTAPTVSVTGVTDSSSYNKGSVPAAGCSVIDAEDGNSSFAATLGAISGAYAADGIGSQTASCSYTDGGGLSDSASATYSIVDPSGPGISSILSPSAPDGTNGWYTTNVSLTWTVTESESPSSLVKTGCVDQTITTDQAETTYSCSATSAGGSAGPTQVTIKRDATAPTIGGSVTPSAAVTGWWNISTGAPTVSFSCSDATSGVATCSGPTTLGEGAGQSVTGNATDNAGNPNSDTVGPLNVDLTPPTVAVTGFDDGDVFYVGGTLPTVGCSSSDGLSGVDTTGGPTITAGGLNSNGVGSVTYTCTASDNAGNSANASKSYSVVYAGLTGILQPINPDNTSVFKRGQAVPVKFKLAGDESFGFGTTGWLIQRQSVACTAFDGADAELESVPSNTPTSYFRYDASADQYVYNADMHTLGVGTCWNFKVTLDSGQIMYSAVFKLAK